MFIQNISPTLIEVGPIEIRYYGLLFASAVMFGFIVLSKTFRESNIDEELADKLSTYTVISLIIGARLVHCIFYNPDYYFSHPEEIIMIWRGGIASHGGALGVIFAIWLFCKNYGFKFEEIADKIAISVTAAPITIRLGNFFNSEIVGKATDVSWATTFVRYDNIPRHPSQLYEAFLGIIVLVIMWNLYWKYHKEKAHGYFMYLFISLYFLQRFLVEFAKEYQTLDPLTSPLTMGQYLSLPFLIFGLVMFWKRSQESKNLERT